MGSRTKRIEKQFAANSARIKKEKKAGKKRRKPATIVLDKRGVPTKAGERSSEVTAKQITKRKEKEKKAKKAPSKKGDVLTMPPPGAQSEESIKARDERRETARLSEEKDIARIQASRDERRGVINLDENKKDVKKGISALREEDSTIGALVRASTDWRTTIALVATLGNLVTLGSLTGILASGGISAGATGTVATARAGTGVVGRITSQKFAHQISQRTGGLIARGTIQTQKAIIGKSPEVASGVSKLFSVGGKVATRIATNPKTQALTISHLAKSGMAIGAAAFVVKEAADTYPFARFELAEATDKIGIAIFTAANAGDTEEVERLTEILNEIVNPNVWDKIIGLLPGANVLQAAGKNVAAAQVSAASILKSSQKKLKDALAKAEEPTFEEKRIISDEAAFERKREFAEEQSERFEKIEEERVERKEEEREKDKEFFEDVDEKNEQKRKDDAAFWKKIIEDNAKRKADERAADEEYWKNIKSKNTTQSWTPADKTVIDNWNAGKSALNFGWLGL